MTVEILALLPARRLRAQERSDRDVNRGLFDLVAALNATTAPHVWIAHYELGAFAGHIFLAHDPVQLVGITTVPRRDLD